MSTDKNNKESNNVHCNECDCCKIKCEDYYKKSNEWVNYYHRKIECCDKKCKDYYKKKFKACMEYYKKRLLSCNEPCCCKGATGPDGATGATGTTGATANVPTLFFNEILGSISILPVATEITVVSVDVPVIVGENVKI